MTNYSDPVGSIDDEDVERLTNEKKMKIKLTACYFPYLNGLIKDHEQLGFKLLEVRSMTWWEKLLSFDQFIAIMEKDL